MADFDDSKIKDIVIGRVEPHIYSFQTNTLPNLLKVGDSYRPVEERLDEWRRHYKDLTEVSRHKALVNENVFFRDHSVHKYLEANGTARVSIDRDHNIYSNEFFEGINGDSVAAAVDDVIDSYGTPGKYTYYDSLKDRIEQHYARESDFAPRDNQQVVINNFTTAVTHGRTNLLMYAVMRFGKSITSMWCAKEIDSKLTLVVSAKADVKSEWKQTVESHKDFSGYRFMESTDLTPGMNFREVYGKEFYNGDGKTEICTNIVLFLTLQDLAGSATEVKKRHEILQSAKPDLLIIDETHFGARAQVLGKILAGIELNEEDEESLKDTDGIDELGKIQGLQAINAKIKLHLSGTPYRILMGSEFAKEDIIAFVQFSDIYESKLAWSANNLDKNEWDNPYYGFPQMIRFAFNPNESSRKKLEELPGSKPSEIFAPVDTNKTGDYETFLHEKEAIDLLQVLDGIKQDTRLLGLLDHPSIKAGKLARHVVIVLPKRASCDALEKLLRGRPELFKNLSDYKVLNISGHNASTSLKKPEQIKAAITTAEANGEKTLTLTVNKMLTGTTVREWDTMIYLKATISPQEYDQAIFRLQSPWIKKYADDSGETIRYDMKPQTLLVDLDPTRLFFLQEAKALSYGANVEKIGNENIEQFVARDLKVSPVLALNAENNKLVEVEASVIIDAVRKYASERSIGEDVNEIGVDISLRDNESISSLIGTLTEINGKNGLNISPIGDDEDGDDIDTGDDVGEDEGDNTSSGSTNSSPADNDEANAIKTFEKQFRMYYVLILLFAFLSTTQEKSLADVITNLDANKDNQRIARSLGLRKEHLSALRETINWSILSSLDYKIQNSDYRANDDTITPVEHINIAINKFGKLSDSEVFTPAHIVDKVYNAFDADFWRSAANAKVLDIASKSGSFARGFVKRAQQEGVSVEDIKNNFYSIPTSPAAYEFTRKMYEALGLNIDNIAQHFTSYDVLELKHVNAITTILATKKLGEITKEDLKATDDKIESDENEGNQVKFSAVVGNPPYQEDTANSRTNPIYPQFMDSSYLLSDKVCLITPGRFLFNAGQSSKQWNEKILNDKHLEVVYFKQKSADIFPNTDIKGGVVITHRDADKILGPIGTFTPFDELNSVLHKVSLTNPEKLSKIIFGNSSYRFTEKLYEDNPRLRGRVSVNEERSIGTKVFSTFPEVFVNNQPSTGDYVCIYGREDNRRIFKWIKREYISSHPNLDKWKVFVPKSNGSGAIGEILSTPLIGEPLIGGTQTFISFGEFDTEIQAQNCMKYIKSKFARAMLGTLKITQHAPKGTWKNVPLQDFTPNSDIDWSKSIPNIDKQLYAKYGLDQDEINFIETHVRAME